MRTVRRARVIRERVTPSAMPALELTDASVEIRALDLAFGTEVVRARDASAKAPTVLVIHGLNSHVGNPNVRALTVALAKRGARAVTFDLPGHGTCVDASGADARGVYTGKEEVVERARATLDAVGGEDTAAAVSICGSSLGGALALYVAEVLRREGRWKIERVVLINPLMKMKMSLPSVAVGALSLLARFIPRLEVSSRPTDVITDDVTGPDIDPDAQAQCDADDLSWKKGVTLRTACGIYDVVGANDRANALVNLSFEVPILVLLGARDTVVIPDEARDKAKLAVSAGGKAEVRIFPTAGHSLTLQSLAKREEMFDLVAHWRWK